MRRPLATTEGETHGHRHVSLLLRLPGLCCQAVGGEEAWADDLTLAWLLFYAAADIMDSVQDRDEPDRWMSDDNPEATLNVASGLYFSGSLALNNLYDREETREVASDVAYDFYNTFMVMASGQQGELLYKQPTLDQYWQIAGAKSGAFFALACRAGARLGSDGRSALQSFGDMGEHIGLYVQIRDDLGDILPLDSTIYEVQKSMILRSLPVVYALEFLTESERVRMLEYLVRADHDPQALGAFVEMIDQSGAALYVQAEMEKQRSLAFLALDRAVRIADVREKIASLLLEVFGQ